MELDRDVKLEIELSEEELEELLRDLPKIIRKLATEDDQDK